MYFQVLDVIITEFYQLCIKCNLELSLNSVPFTLLYPLSRKKKKSKVEFKLHFF